MHPPTFRHEHLLSDWPDCHLEIRCPKCRTSVLAPTRMLRRAHGDRSFTRLVGKLKCRECGTPPAPVYLLASQHRTRLGGPPPDWAVEIVPPPGV